MELQPKLRPKVCCKLCPKLLVSKKLKKKKKNLLVEAIVLSKKLVEYSGLNFNSRKSQNF